MASQKRFVSILSDTGFKRTFGNRTDTSFLKRALEILIKSDEPIKEIRFNDTVQTPDYDEYRGAVFDVHCIDEKERSFIVEMQRSELSKFIHRAKFYTYLHLNEMIEKGGKIRFNKLRPIYAVSILDGVAHLNSSEFHQFVCLRNQHGELIDDQITHVLLELGKWNKTEQEVVSDLDILILLMKFVETATVDTPTPKVLTRTEWAAWVMKKLEQKDLTRAERLFYRKEQAKIGYYEGLEEDAAERAAETERKMAEAEQQIQQAKQQIQQAEQKSAEIEQKLIKAEQISAEVEQKTITMISNFLKEGSFSEEKIAELIDIDISQVREVKKQLK